METIKVQIDWCGKNYAAYIYSPDFGLVTTTAKTAEQIKEAAAKALRFHIEGCRADGDDLPKWLTDGNYTLQFEMRTSAMMHQMLDYTTIAALSRASGISHSQLSHYANAVAEPRPAQKQKIIDGFHAIGRACMEFA